MVTHCNTRFTCLKEKLGTCDCLCLPDYSAPFIFIADAFTKAVGFTLSQKLSNGLKPILMEGHCL